MRSIRVNYWSLSKLGSWLRAKSGIKTPWALTLEEWNKYHSEHKNKLGYIIAEYLDTLQDVLMFPYDLYYEIKYYIKNRWITKTHCLMSDLKKGEWHDLSERILHTNFDSLSTFVEEECSLMNYFSFTKQERKENKHLLRTKEGRRKLGLEYLLWSISLGKESPVQSANAKEIKELYLWWERHKKIPSLYSEPQLSTIKYIANKKGVEYFDLIEEMEEKTEAKEKEMLHRLIDIRKSLWT